MRKKPAQNPETRPSRGVGEMNRHRATISPAAGLVGRFRNWATAISLLLCIGLPAVPAWSDSSRAVRAVTGDPSRQVAISADKAETRSLSRGYETVFRGNVKVSQADMTLTCERLITVYEQKEGSKVRSGGLKVPSGNGMDSDNLKTITALGHVRIVQRDSMATAGKAVYSHGKRTVTLSESPRLRQGANTLQANTILVVLDEDHKGIERGDHAGKPKNRSGKPKTQPANGANTESLKTITASGHVEIAQGDRKATAGKAVYDNAKRTVTLSDNPRLRQGANVLQAKTMVIYMDENRMEFEGGDGRIKGTLDPGRQEKKEKP